jgi:hypothetical protein
MKQRFFIVLILALCSLSARAQMVFGGSSGPSLQSLTSVAHFLTQSGANGARDAKTAKDCTPEGVAKSGLVVGNCRHLPPVASGTLGNAAEPADPGRSTGVDPQKQILSATQRTDVGGVDESLTRESSTSSMSAINNDGKLKVDDSGAIYHAGFEAGVGGAPTMVGGGLFRIVDSRSRQPLDQTGRLPKTPSPTSSNSESQSSATQTSPAAN